MAGIPILPWEPPPLSNNIYASEIMNRAVVTLKTVENVGHIVELLKCVTFNGFPVVDCPSSDQVINFVYTFYFRARNFIFLSFCKIYFCISYFRLKYIPMGDFEV